MGKEDIERRPRVVLVIRSLILNDENQVLLIQRSANDSWDPGLWEFPGGKVEIGRDASHALEDEVLEEAGLVVDPITHIGVIESENIAKGKYAGLPYVVITGVSRAVRGEVKISEEHDAYKWVPIYAAPEMQLTKTCRKSLVVLGNYLAESGYLGSKE